MPRYSYYCESCEQSSEAFHSISEQLSECPLCKSEGQLVKLVSKPMINTTTKSSDTTVKERVEDHIESARAELMQQRADLKQEDLINDD